MFSIFDQLCVSVQALRDSEHSYNDLLTWSYKINLEYKEILEEFYKEYITSHDKMYQYLLNPEWGEASGNYRMRFMIVSINGDFVLVPLKVMDPMGKERYFAISMEPVSYKGILDNVIEVMEVLQIYTSIEFIMLSGDFDKDVYMNNFYNTIEEFNQMNRSAWKSKKGINKISKLVDIQTDCDLDFAVNSVKKIDDLWNEQKKSQKKTTLPAKVDISLTKMWGRYQDMFLYLYLYSGIALGYSIGVTTCEKYISLLSTKSLTQLPEERLKEYLNESDEEVIRQIKKYLGAYIQYSIHKDILLDKGYEALYYYGDVHSKSLREFKQDYYKRVINYYKILLSEYINILKEKN